MDVMFPSNRPKPPGHSKGVTESTGVTRDLSDADEVAAAAVVEEVCQWNDVNPAQADSRQTSREPLDPQAPDTDESLASDIGASKMTDIEGNQADTDAAGQPRAFDGDCEGADRKGLDKKMSKHSALQDSDPLIAEQKASGRGQTTPVASAEEVPRVPPQPQPQDHSKLTTKKDPPKIKNEKKEVTAKAETQPRLPDGDHTAADGKEKNKAGQVTKVTPSQDSDPFGAELGKDARFWKVYVDEADRHDNELVDGWNKSLDVILVFAALFSAVSTAFIIESSKKLQPDPIEASAETLLAISQTLLAIASNTQLESLDPALRGNSTLPFVPSYTSVIVNALWYLSLSLSIATSLMAMLAKEWCRSFQANRTGHPYSQAQRRQEKWVMIERWRMQELLVVLPSLIHLSLLLFAIGLCINVWGLNNTVAIPVICVCGIAISFYISSSIAASLLEFFPYTTIVSNIIRSKPTQALLRESRNLVRLTWSHLFCYHLPRLICYHLPRVTNFLVSLGRLIGCNCLVLPLRCFGVFLPAWLDWSYRLHFCDILDSDFSDEDEPFIFDRLLELIPQWSPKEPDNSSPGASALAQIGNVHRDEITSKALGWFIEYCENPKSIAIGLQAIAGASSRLPRKPLEDCEATRKILRVLVSNRTGEGSSLDTQRYVRALKFLGTDASESSSTDELEVMIWDLQLANESYISELVTQGRFQPDERNRAVLRVGSIIPMHILQMLKEDNGFPKATLDEITSMVNDLGSDTHPATCASLMNAVVLVSAALPHCLGSQEAKFIEFCLSWIQKEKEEWGNWNITSDARAMHGQLALILCILNNGLGQNGAPSRCDHPVSRHLARIKTTVSLLYDSSPAKRQGTLLVSWMATRDIVTKSAYRRLSDRANLPIINKGVFYRYLDQIRKPTDAMCHLEVIYQIYELFPVETPPILLYMSIVELVCRVPVNWKSEHLESLMSRFAFPQLSDELTTILRERNIIPLLVTTWHNHDYRNHFASTQLWLLYALLGNLPPSSYSPLQTQLSNMLQGATRFRFVPGTLEKRRFFEGYILTDCGMEVREYKRLGTYSYRVAECVCEISDGRYAWRKEDRTATMNKIPDMLKDVPESLRRLSSFTPPEIWPLETTSQPVPQPEMVIGSPSSGDAHIEMDE